MTTPNLSSVISLIEEGHNLQAAEDISTCLLDQSTAKKLSECGEKISQMRKIETENKETLKEIIQGYLDLKAEQQTIVADTQCDEGLAQEILNAQNNQTHVNEKLNNVQKDVQAVQCELDHLSDQQLSLDSHRDSVREATTEVLPKTRYNVSLYRSATKLTWDHSSQDGVKGYISTSKDVRPFSLDNRQNSKFFITNYLWDLIESTANLD